MGYSLEIILWEYTKQLIKPESIFHLDMLTLNTCDDEFKPSPQSLSECYYIFFEIMYHLLPSNLYLPLIQNKLHLQFLCNFPVSYDGLQGSQSSF